jgi:hypothetical protein
MGSSGDVSWEAATMRQQLPEPWDHMQLRRPYETVIMVLQVLMLRARCI